MIATSLHASGQHAVCIGVHDLAESSCEPSCAHLRELGVEVVPAWLELLYAQIGAFGLHAPFEFVRGVLAGTAGISCDPEAPHLFGRHVHEEVLCRERAIDRHVRQGGLV